MSGTAATPAQARRQASRRPRWARQGSACVAALLWLPALAAPPASCGAELAGARRVASGPAELAWVARPVPLAVGRQIELEVVLCGALRAAELRVDADMPAHRHGMNYRASLERLAPGRWRARGLLFHMPGTWRLIFDLDDAGRRTRLTDTVELP